MQINGPTPFFIKNNDVFESMRQRSTEDFEIPNYAKEKNFIASTNIYLTAA